MSSKKQTDAEFQASLRERLHSSGQSAPGGLHLTPTPSGKSVSLEEMLKNNSGGLAAAPEPQTGAEINPGRDIAATDVVVQALPIDVLVESPWQPRMHYDETALTELATSLKLKGQDEPVHVFVAGTSKQFQIISGHRRVRAAKLAGWSNVNAIVHSIDERQAKIATLTANEGREDLTDYERGLAYQRARDEGLATSQSEIATLFSCSQGRVSQCLSLLKLPADFIKLLKARPGLINYRRATMIKELLAEFPNDAATVLLVTEGLIDEPEMESSDFMEKVRGKLKKVGQVTPATQHRLFRDTHGRDLFTLRTSANKVVIDIKGEFDVEVLSSHAAVLLESLLGQSLPSGKQK